MPSGRRFFIPERFVLPRYSAVNVGDGGSSSWVARLRGRPGRDVNYFEGLINGVGQVVEFVIEPPFISLSVLVALTILGALAYRRVISFRSAIKGAGVVGIATFVAAALQDDVWHASHTAEYAISLCLCLLAIALFSALDVPSESQTAPVVERRLRGTRERVRAHSPEKESQRTT